MSKIELDEITCGTFGGRDSDGKPCKNDPGEGRDGVQHGTCWLHVGQENEDFQRCPDPPSSMSAPERRYWYQTVPPMQCLGIWNPADRMLVVSLCQLLVIRDKATERIREDGMIIYDQKNDRKRKHPAVAIRRRHMKEIRATCNSLGLSVNSRQQLPDLDDDGDDSNKGMRKYRSTPGDDPGED